MARSRPIPLPGRLALFATLLLLPLGAAEAPAGRKAEPPQRPPTFANVAYGSHERQVLDFWRAESPQPAPLVLHIHGGGWVNGDKARVPALERYLAAGISVVSINYRFVTQAIRAGVEPPVRWRTPPARCSSYAPGPPSGTSTPRASARPAPRPVPAPASGSRSTTTSRIRRARIPSHANRPASGAPRSSARRRRSTQRR